MIKFYDTNKTASELGISRDQVIHLIQEGRLSAKRVGSRGDYIIHPVDVARLKRIRRWSKEKQVVLKPDIVWIEEACKYLIDLIGKTFQPKVVVGIARGGLVPASLLSIAFEAELVYVKISHYEGHEKLLGPILIKAPLQLLDVPHLIVDDLVDSGETMECAYEYLVTNQVSKENIRCATLHRKPSSRFTPDWFVSVLEGWVDYPWED